MTKFPDKHRLKLPWPELMRLAFGSLRMNAQNFWSMTPKEFLAMLEARGMSRRTGPPDREQLIELMRFYPDQMEKIDDTNDPNNEN